MRLQPIKVEQVAHQRQQMVGRRLHILQIEPLPLAVVEPHHQFYISDNRTERSLEVVRNCQHQLLASLQQLFGPTAGLLQFATPAVVAHPAPPHHDAEYQRQHDSPRSDSHQSIHRLLADGLVAVENPLRDQQLLLFEAAHQPTYLPAQPLVVEPQPPAFPLEGLLREFAALVKATLHRLQVQSQRIAQGPNPPRLRPDAVESARRLARYGIGYAPEQIAPFALLHERIALLCQQLLMLMDKKQGVLLAHHVVELAILLLGHINRRTHQPADDRIFPVQQIDNAVDTRQLHRIGSDVAQRIDTRHGIVHQTPVNRIIGIAPPHQRLPQGLGTIEQRQRIGYPMPLGRHILLDLTHRYQQPYLVIDKPRGGEQHDNEQQISPQRLVAGRFSGIGRHSSRFGGEDKKFLQEVCRAKY